MMPQVGLFVVDWLNIVISGVHKIELISASHWVEVNSTVPAKKESFIMHDKCMSMFITVEHGVSYRTSCLSCPLLCLGFFLVRRQTWKKKGIQFLSFIMLTFSFCIMLV